MIFRSGGSSIEMDNAIRAMTARLLRANPTIARRLEDTTGRIRHRAEVRWPRNTGRSARQMTTGIRLTPTGLVAFVGNTASYAPFIRFKGTRALVWRQLIARPGVRGASELADALADDLARLAVSG